MDKKLAPHFAWLFAAAAVGLGVLFSLVLAKQSWTVVSAAVGLSFALAGAASSYLTRASKAQALTPIIIAGLGVGVVTFVAVKHALQAAADLGGGADTLVTGVAIFFTAKVLGITLIAGIAGALGGFQLRGKSFGELLKRPS